MPSAVSRPTAAPSIEALAYFESLMKYETDCWDVHHAITNNRQDFILLDVRNHEAYQKGHIKGSVNIPQTRLNEENLSKYSKGTLLVVYCAGPHCNATEKAAIKIAKLNRPVKKMIGGVTGWLDEGFRLEESN